MRNDRSSNFWLGILAVAIVGSLVYFLPFAERPNKYETPLGGQKIVRIADGSECTLNSQSAVEIRESRNYVAVALLRGEILCRVNHRLGRTLEVYAGKARVTDTGTVFDVRMLDGRDVVTLVEGSVQLAINDELSKHSLNSRSNTRIVSAGERWAVIREADRIVTIPEAVSLPQIHRSIAWERGRAIFDHDTVIDAVAEINRYNSLQIVVTDPAVGVRRVDGNFLATDPLGFVQAVTHELHIHYKQNPQSGSAETIYLEP
jgi:transmembrane sensor